MAPIIYAALAKSPGTDGAAAGAVGSRLGLFLAGAVTNKPDKTSATL
jgi:hypothetical protein